MATLVRTQISLTAEHMERLRQLAAERRTPIAALVREAVDQLLGEADRHDRMVRALNAARSPGVRDRQRRTDIAERHDDHLADPW